MSDLENRLDEKLKYLYEMFKKYNDLNDQTKYKYLYRENAIQTQIEALEELRDNVINDTWEVCYKEDHKEFKGEINTDPWKSLQKLKETIKQSEEYDMKNNE